MKIETNNMINNKAIPGTSLVVQWLRLWSPKEFPMQGICV